MAHSIPSGDSAEDRARPGYAFVADRIEKAWRLGADGYAGLAGVLGRHVD